MIQEKMAGQYVGDVRARLPWALPRGAPGLQAGDFVLVRGLLDQRKRCDAVAA